MVNKIREITVPTISYLEEVRGGDVSENQDVQRRFCSDNSFINGIGVTVLTGDYLPPIILGEIPIGQGMVQKYIVDAMQRTSALMMIRYGNYRFTSTIEGNEIEYQEKMRDENGRVCKDEEGSIIWEQKVFDIKGKTFSDLPDELKKRFDVFQLRVVVHENCTMGRISELIRRYNNHRGMNASQKALTYLDLYARKVKTITDTNFFKECIDFSEKEKCNGTYEKIVCEAAMTVFHLDDWKKVPKQMNLYLNENGNEEEFNTVQEYMNRIYDVCEDRFRNIFVLKDIAVWIAIFAKFTKMGCEDTYFAGFAKKLVEEWHDKVIDGDSYDSLYKETGTKDKGLIKRKIAFLTSLLEEYFDKSVEESKNISIEQFVAECIEEDVDVVAEDIDAYRETLEELLVVYVDKESKLRDEANRSSLLAMMAYSYKIDFDLDDWMAQYAKNNNTYFIDQKKNFLHMKKEFDEYITHGQARISA